MADSSEEHRTARSSVADAVADAVVDAVADPVADARADDAVDDVADARAGGGVDEVDDEENALRTGPWWRHALWVSFVPLAGVAVGWLDSLHRFWPEEYGVPLLAEGAVWPYLVAWFAIGAAGAAVLRTAATRVPMRGATVLVLACTFMGTRLSLPGQPGPAVMAVVGAVLVLAAVGWAVLAVRRGGPQVPPDTAA
ncbi:hypothetical protein MTQ01_01780 [Streptomyces sp. XM4193]|uniref:hypothetical protein n=1 Tax=Streptomyces sp. XM4193 TaxID=2929782 RepID=UPI001FFBD04C|nr:hypothetical protein [Streptomyces sp. XM4193]MCK1794774.1 hypothetical protein [Streptomyces sp. XM4193]